MFIAFGYGVLFVSVPMSDFRKMTTYNMPVIYLRVYIFAVYLPLYQETTNNSLSL